MEATCRQLNGELPFCTARSVIEISRGDCGNAKKGYPGHNGEGGETRGCEKAGVLRKSWPFPKDKWGFHRKKRKRRGHVVLGRDSMYKTQRQETLCMPSKCHKETYAKWKPSQSHEFKDLPFSAPWPSSQSLSKENEWETFLPPLYSASAQQIWGRGVP